MDILSRFAEVKVLVIGDVMLDRYWWGSVDRVSPEAPVPVVRLDRASFAAGGAANVAANVAGLGATPILLGIMGDDAESRILPGVLSDSGVSAGHLVSIPGRPTTVKTRIVAHGQQVARIDQESADPISPDAEAAILEKFEALIPGADSIVVSDYAKGMLTNEVLKVVIAKAREHGIPVLVDPKGRDYAKYRGATLLTPNRREAADACGLEENDQKMVDVAGRKLLADLGVQSVLITQGEHGMTLFTNGDPPHHLDTLARDVYDVTGAGDTVIGSLAVATGARADLKTAAHIANVAAGIAVEQVGTTAISITSLRESLAAL